MKSKKYPISQDEFRPYTHKKYTRKPKCAKVSKHTALPTFFSKRKHRAKTCHKYSRIIEYGYKYACRKTYDGKTCRNCRQGYNLRPLHFSHTNYRNSLNTYCKLPFRNTIDNNRRHPFALVLRHIVDDYGYLPTYNL